MSVELHFDLERTQSGHDEDAMLFFEGCTTFKCNSTEEQPPTEPRVEACRPTFVLVVLPWCLSQGLSWEQLEQLGSKVGLAVCWLWWW